MTVVLAWWSKEDDCTTSKLPNDTPTQAETQARTQAPPHTHTHTCAHANTEERIQPQTQPDDLTPSQCRQLAQTHALRHATHIPASTNL
eukprot:803534-Alexandrium_andersonii.AAC.1